jgi:hypothetical protein
VSPKQKQNHILSWSSSFQVASAWLASDAEDCRLHLDDLRDWCHWLLNYHSRRGERRNNDLPEIHAAGIKTFPLTNAYALIISYLCRVACPIEKKQTRSVYRHTCGACTTVCWYSKGSSFRFILPSGLKPWIVAETQHLSAELKYLTDWPARKVEGEVR